MKKNIQEVITQQNCDGCGACLNICPVSAIKLEPDSDTFIMPVVNDSKCIKCGKCVSVCPVLHCENPNLRHPSAWAFRAGGEISRHCSAGGFFGLLAKKYVDEGGYVCGVILNDSGEAEFKIAKTWEEILPMRGSKYVQANPGNIYKETKRLLDNNKRVLFTGTPCQVAGLYSFLGERPKNLLTVDLICHGVPSQEFFQEHLEEIRNGKKVESLTFRGGKDGWTSTQLEVRFDGGGEYLGLYEVPLHINRIKNDAYLRGLFSGLTVRPSCLDCPFSAFPRAGDLSMGDFAGNDGIVDLPPSSAGVSLIFSNSLQGDKVIDWLRGADCVIKEIKDISKIKNRLTASISAPAGRKRFFDLVKTKRFSTAVNDSLDGKYDVGLLSLYAVLNFGGSLTCYALYKVLEDLGFSTLIIERPMSSWSWHKPMPLPLRYYKENPYPEYALSPFYENKVKMKELSYKCSAFVVGSDQLFSDFLYTHFDKMINLDWVKDNNKKIGYAISFGFDHIWHTEYNKNELNYFLNKYDAISTREKSGVDLLEKEFNIKAEHVLDPVFICNPECYDQLIEKAPRETEPAGPFVFGYFLDTNPLKEKIFLDRSNMLGEGYRFYSEFFNAPATILNLSSGSVNERLRDMKNSEFIVTDSFHGACFAIIFRKDFIVIGNEDRGLTRFHSILSLLGLEDRMVLSEEDYNLKKETLGSIDYERVYNILEAEKGKSLAWLKAGLEDNKHKCFSDYDILRDYVDFNVDQLFKLTVEQDKIIQELRSRLDKLEKKE